MPDEYDLPGLPALFIPSFFSSTLSPALDDGDHNEASGRIRATLPLLSKRNTILSDSFSR